MLNWITNTIAAWGYVGISLLMLLENIIPPIPSELIMPLAGFTASQGKLNVIYVVVAGVFGSIVGALPWYYIGKLVGEHQLRHWIQQYGRWLTLSVSDFERSRRWFRQYGRLIVFLGRIIPGIRTLISVPAGLEGMPLLPFLLYSTCGTLLWVGFLTAAGYFLGQNYERVQQFLRPIGAIVLIVLGIIIGVWLARRLSSQSEH